MAVLGLRGKGKTVTASVIVEELLKRRVQVVALVGEPSPPSYIM